MARTFSNDERFHEEIARETLETISKTDLSRTPPEMGAHIEKRIFQMLSLEDPYAPIRKKYNTLVLSMLPRFSEQVSTSDNPFDTAMRLAIGGNIIDFGNQYTMHEGLMYETLERALLDPIFGESPNVLQEAVARASSILYIGDNCGEIVLDRLFIETLGPEKVTFAVRGSPILNDVIRGDAEETGMAQLVPIVDTGQKLPGVLPESASPEFREVWQRVDLVIAKGQGNYETLSDTGKPVAFLLKAKCDVIAQHLEVSQGAMVMRLKNMVVL
jgi:uncharacterized protein with ATP-grasp and redox domains